MADKEKDPTEQVEIPKGRADEPSAVELTPGDFESVRPVTGTRQTQEAPRPPEPAPKGARGAAWLALLLVLALAGAAAWFMVTIHVPMEDRLHAQAEQLRKAQKEAVDLAAAIAPLKSRLEQLEGEVEELRVAADQEKPAPETGDAKKAQ